MPEGPLVELTLYVSATSAASLRAQVQIQKALAEFDSSRVRFEVLDVARDVRRAEEDRVIFTPTLVKRQPAPPAWFVGDAGGSLMAVLLASCGVEKAR
jgi:circadian clock protein KaiB